MTTDKIDGYKGLATPPVVIRGLNVQTDTQTDDFDSDSSHSAQSSNLAARPGGLMLDYLRVRLPDDRPTWEALGGWLGERTTRPFGWQRFYDSSAMVLDGGLVAWCSDKVRAERQGVLVDLPGRACACLGERLGPFLSWCLATGNVTRCDFAIDDRAGRLTYERIMTADASGAIVSRWQGVNVIQTLDQGKRKGWTIYLGKRKGSAMVRIYDKAAEQNKPALAPWIRFELEAKSKFADALAREYEQRGPIAVTEQINRRLSFRVASESDTNPRRWPVAPWWSEFVGSLDKGASLLCGEKPEATIDALWAFLEHQAMPALVAVLSVPGGDARLTAALDAAEHRLKPKHHHAIAMAIDEDGKDRAKDVTR